MKENGRNAFSSSFYQAFFEGNSGMYFVFDPDTGQIMDANKAACDYYLYTKEQICRLNIVDINIWDPNLLRTSIAEVIAKKNCIWHFKHRLANGEIRKVEVKATVLEFDGEIFIAASVSDIDTMGTSILQKEEWQRSASEDVFTGIVIADIHSYCVYSNVRGNQILSNQVQEGLKIKWEDMLCDSELKRFQAAFENAAKGQKTIDTFEFKFDRNTPIYIEVALERLSNYFLILSVKDVTDYKRLAEELKQSENRYQLLFNKALNGICMIELVYDENGKPVDYTFVELNPALEKQYNIKAKFARGKTRRDVLSEASGNLDVYKHVLDSGESESFEYYDRIVKRHFRVNAFKQSNKIIGLVIADISECKAMIEQLQTLNMELEFRVNERTRALRNALDELETFSYTISHDLKTPLRAIESYCRIVMEDYGEHMDPVCREMLTNAKSITSDLIQTVGKLLEYSLTNKPFGKTETVELGEIFETAFDEIKSLHLGRNINLTIEKDLPYVKGDRLLLKQAIYNVVSNAVKFTGKREEARIEVGFNTTSSENVFYVRDNGVGFEARDSQKLFNIFQRLNTAEEFEGSGIGLAAVKKIIKKHSGRVWIEGEPDKGATVYFALPKDYDT